MLFYKFAPLITALSLSLQLSAIEALLTERTSSLALSSSFRSLSKFRPSRFLSMDMSSASDAQAKREQSSVIRKQVTTHTDDNNNLFTPKVIFHNPPSRGAGIDERFALSSDEDVGVLEHHASMLTKVHMSYMQMGLLSDLSSDKIGTIDKFEKVKASSKLQILSSSADYQWSPTSAHTGGLLNDWTFDLE